MVYNFKKNLNKSFTIVGAGITGCIISIYLKKLGCDVQIVEKKSEMGGIMSDFKNEDFLFLKGCHYLDPNQKWLKLLDKNTLQELVFFNHEYSSLTDLDNSKILSPDFALPVFKYRNMKLLNKNIVKNDLLQRIHNYPNQITKKILQFVSKFNVDLNKFDYDEADSFHIERVNYFQRDKEILKSKIDKNVDNLIAVKRKLLKKNENFKAGIPKNGYNSFFKKIHKHLSDLKIPIFLNLNIKPEFKNNKVNLKSNQKIRDYENIIWTGNPTALVKNLLDNNLETIPIQIQQISIVTKKKLNNRYYQIFSKNHNCIRVQTYVLNKKNIINLEFIHSKKNDYNVKILNSILIDLKIRIPIKEISQYIKNFYVRYDLVSSYSKELLYRLYKKSENTNLICSPWLTKGRDQKINYLLNLLKSKLN